MVLLDATAQILDAAAREIVLRLLDPLLEAVRLLVRGRDLRDVGRVQLRPEEVAARQSDEDEQRHDLAALVGR